MKKLVRELQFHFLLIGAALFDNLDWRGKPLPVSGCSN